MNIYFSIAAIVISIFIGWEVRTWYDEAHVEKQAIHAEQKAAAGEVKIIHDTQIITKVVHDEKDTCVNKPIPTDLRKQL